MKTLMTFLIAAASLNASATKLYKCTFTAERNGHVSIQMTGHILNTDTEKVTYLTLQPAKLSGVEFDARVLITGYGYNPLTIHPRGYTPKAVAHTTLNTEGETKLDYVDDAGLKYNLTCSSMAQIALQNY